MSSELIRSSNDLELFEELSADSHVQRVNQSLETIQKQFPAQSTRRHLLSSSVRLSESMAPALHEMANHCSKKLGMDIPLELYVYSNPNFNAACFKPENGRLFIMFSSSILERFDAKELLFVMGHELGHHLYRHHDIPIGYILKGKERPPANLALRLFAWSRYAEISADRAGAYCAKAPASVAKSLFKLSSGISSDHIVKFDLETFMAQVDDMMTVDSEPGQGAPAQDWFLTHPFSPLRVHALQAFDRSEFMKEGGISKEKLELESQKLMQLMEPDYLLAKTDADKAMKNLFVAGALLVAAADGEISEAERSLFTEYLDDSIDLSRLSKEKLRELLPERIERVKALSTLAQRMQVLRDLCLMAKSDDELHGAERKVLAQISRELELPGAFLECCSEQGCELD